MAHQSIEEWLEREAERSLPEWERVHREARQKAKETAGASEQGHTLRREAEMLMRSDFMAALNFEHAQGPEKAEADAWARTHLHANRRWFAEGLMFMRGEGAPRDYEAAARLFFRAARFGLAADDAWRKRPGGWVDGHPGAWICLGMLCASGQGMPKSAEMAARCFREARSVSDGGTYKRFAKGRFPEDFGLYNVVNLPYDILSIAMVGLVFLSFVVFALVCAYKWFLVQTEVAQQGVEVWLAWRFASGLGLAALAMAAFSVFKIGSWLLHAPFRWTKTRLVSGYLACCFLAFRP